MGCGASRVACPKCGKNTLRDGVQLMEHLKQNHSFGSAIAPVAPSHSKLKSKCKFCGIYIVVDELADHLEEMHIKDQSPKTQLITCPKCGQNDLENGQIFINHLKTVHELTDRSTDVQQEERKKIFACPKCHRNDIQDGKKFLEHLKNVHDISDINNIEVEPPIIHKNKKLPKVGDRVLAMWAKSKWQYFHATIVRFIEDSLRYEIDWDDGGTTGNERPLPIRYVCTRKSERKCMHACMIYTRAHVWCGVVWCGVVRCGAMRCGAVRCGAVRCGAVRARACVCVHV